MTQLRRPTLILALLALLAVTAMGCAGAARPYDQGLLAHVNAHRAGAGLPPVAWCPALGRAAGAHAADQAARNTMTHTGGDGSDTATRVARANYRGWNALGENVAAGYPTEGEVFLAWMNSPSHRANILSPNYTHVGSGAAVSGNGTRYWTQDFGRAGTC